MRRAPFARVQWQLLLLWAYCVHIMCDLSVMIWDPQFYISCIVIDDLHREVCARARMRALGPAVTLKPRDLCPSARGHAICSSV